MLTFAAMAAVADAVLRMVACDAPSALSLHYSGRAAGPGEPFAIELRRHGPPIFRPHAPYISPTTPGEPFAIELRHFERESERCQLLLPHLAAAR